jgi:predicted Zn-dependent protease with MMP-like domain
MTDEQFEALVAQGIDDLREDVQRRLKNIAIVIEDMPTREQLWENNVEEGGTLFGLYEGVPLTDRGIEEPLFPDKVTIFKNPILAAYTDPEDIRACVSNTIWHEIAHHFGLDEEAVAYEEERRGKTL